jgi:DNA-binding transcriptional regulator YiaG
MKSSIKNVIRKKRGRPATGSDPIISMRMPVAIRRKVSEWAQKQDLSLSKAVIALLQKALAVSTHPGCLSIHKVSVRQIKAARALLAWSQAQLARASSVSVPTIKRLESKDGPLGGRRSTAIQIRAALESSGVEFIDENGGGPGVRLKKPRAADERRR